MKNFLLILGSPLWVPLLIAGCALLFSLYAVLWAVIILLWAVLFALACCAVAGIILGIGYVLVGNGFVGAFAISVGLVSSGLSVFLFFGYIWLKISSISLTKRVVSGIKYGFI